MIRPFPNSSHVRTHAAARVLAALVVLTFVALTAATACIRDEDLTLEQRQHQLERQIMCPVCDGETLDQSQSQTAQDMKQLISEKLQAGETNQDIKDYFVESYRTQEILAAPPATGFNLVAWLMPGAIVLGGAAIVFFAIRGMRRPRASNVIAPAERSLAPYLEQVDHDLGMDAGNPKERAGG